MRNIRVKMYLLSKDKIKCVVGYSSRHKWKTVEYFERNRSKGGGLTPQNELSVPE